MSSGGTKPEVSAAALSGARGSELKLPGDARLRSPSIARAKPTIIFIHQYAGNRESSKAQQDLVLELGYACVSFTMNTRLKEAKIPDWADQLRAVLDAVPGPKILFSFSFPSVSVVELLGRGSRPDVLAWICDGGPFSEIYRCYWNLLTYLKYGNWFTRFTSTGYNYLAARGPLYNAHVKRNLERMQVLPILSIRNAHDPLVPPRATDKFFGLNPRLVIQRLPIESGGHLDAIKVAPKIYREAVTAFLAAVTAR